MPRSRHVEPGGREMCAYDVRHEIRIEQSSPHGLHKIHQLSDGQPGRREEVPSWACVERREQAMRGSGQWRLFLLDKSNQNYASGNINIVLYCYYG